MNASTRLPFPCALSVQLIMVPKVKHLKPMFCYDSDNIKDSKTPRATDATRKFLQGLRELQDDPIFELAKGKSVQPIHRTRCASSCCAALFRSALDFFPTVVT